MLTVDLHELFEHSALQPCPFYSNSQHVGIPTRVYMLRSRMMVISPARADWKTKKKIEKR